jgi:molybdate transport system ATP-binding protein
MAGRLLASFVRQHGPAVSVRADLALDAGDERVMVLFGPSGSGKTTILRCLAGLDRPQEGFIRFGDEIWFDAAAGIAGAPAAPARKSRRTTASFRISPSGAHSIRRGPSGTARARSRQRDPAHGRSGEWPGGARSTVGGSGGASRWPARLARRSAAHPARRAAGGTRPAAARSGAPGLRQFLRSIGVPSVVVTTIASMR